MGCLLLKSLIKIYNIQIPTKNLVGIFLFTSMNIPIIRLGLIDGSIALAFKKKFEYLNELIVLANAIKRFMK